MVSGIIKEQNQKFVDFLDYDKIQPITMMLQAISAKHNIDRFFSLTAMDEFLACNMRKAVHDPDMKAFTSFYKTMQSR